MAECTGKLKFMLKIAENNLVILTTDQRERDGFIKSEIQYTEIL